MPLPAGACDCHIHVFEPAYPLAPTARVQPPAGSGVQGYRTLQAALGLARAVVVQPTGYGFDNSCTLAAVASLGADARGVAVIDASASDAMLEQLHAGGIRGVRFMMLPGGAVPWDMLEPVAARIAPLGWHVDLQVDGAEFPRLQQRLARLAVPLVIDHNGKFLTPVAPSDPAFLALRALMDSGRCWIKLSAPYETSRTGAPEYADVGVLASTLAQAYPQRCLWASNWPHLGQGTAPQETDLLALLRTWAGDETRLRRILVDNPQQLYGF